MPIFLARFNLNNYCKGSKSPRAWPIYIFLMNSNQGICSFLSTTLGFNTIFTSRRSRTSVINGNRIKSSVDTRNIPSVTSHHKTGTRTLIAAGDLWKCVRASSQNRRITKEFASLVEVIIRRAGRPDIVHVVGTGPVICCD